MVLLIQAAVQAALGAIAILRQLGYLKDDHAQQAMQIVMNGHIPDDQSDSPTQAKGLS